MKKKNYLTPNTKYHTLMGKATLLSNSNETNPTIPGQGPYTIIDQTIPIGDANDIPLAKGHSSSSIWDD